MNEVVAGITTPLLRIEALEVEFRGRYRSSRVQAVDGVDLTILPNETVGLVGETGSGKSTIGNAILGLCSVQSGSITFAGSDITRISYRDRRKLATQIQVIFQDPYRSLNPTRTIGQTLSEMLRSRTGIRSEEVTSRVSEILDRVGMPKDAINRYPGQFSGGQRQRIAIARALIIRPRLIVCDEPVSALDLSVQAQVLNLLREIQESFGVSYLFIAHDLAVVRHLSHRVVVLYHGCVMEEGPAETVYETPFHPYTIELIEAAPLPDPVQQRRRSLDRVARRFELVSGAKSAGCRFAARCPYAIDVCRMARPPLEQTTRGSLVACHRWRELSGS